jgi:hypothetical protein
VEDGIEPIQIPPNRATRRKQAREKAKSSAPVYDPDTRYVTQWELAMLLRMQPASLSRWVKQWQMGLGIDPIVRTHGTTGYSIPINYVLVGRGWQQTKDEDSRQVLLQVLIENPKPWVVVVADQGVTCYTAEQASEVVQEILSRDEVPGAIRVYYVGEVPDP